jgi:hypothetical protein
MTTKPSYRSIGSEDSWMELNEDIIDRNHPKAFGYEV